MDWIVGQVKICWRRCFGSSHKYLFVDGLIERGRTPDSGKLLKLKDQSYHERCRFFLLASLARFPQIHQPTLRVCLLPPSLPFLSFPLLHVVLLSLTSQRRQKRWLQDGENQHALVTLQQMLTVLQLRQILMEVI